jgi:COMPASS component SPP1
MLAHFPVFDCHAETPNISLKTTYRLRCRYGLDHPEPDSPAACHKPARGVLSKYCSPECGFNNMKKRIDTFTENGGDKELLWDSVKDAQKREAVVIVHEVVTEGCMTNTDPLLVTTTRVKPPAMVKVEWELTGLNAKLNQVLALREDLQEGLKFVFWRARLLELARERAERVGRCGWDQRLCFSADQWAESGQAGLDGYGEGEDMQVGAENWCESERCERHAGYVALPANRCSLTRVRSWQTIRANDITKEKENKEEALLRQTTREHQIRKRIEDIVETFNRSGVGPTGAPLNTNTMDRDRKKGKKRKNPS